METANSFNSVMSYQIVDQKKFGVTSQSLVAFYKTDVKSVWSVILLSWSRGCIA